MAIYHYDSAGVFYDAPNVRYDGVPLPKPQKTRMDKIKLEFKSKSALETIQMAKDIKTNMAAAVADFATPDPTDAAFQTNITAAETANNDYEASKLVTEAKKLVRDEALEVTRDDIRARARYAEQTVHGDSTKLQPIFALRGTSAPIGALGQVTDLSVTEGDNDGELDPAWDRLRGATSYEVQVSIDPPTPASWQLKMSSPKSRCTISGLTSGAKTWVRVRGVGAAGPGPWSDPAVKTVP
jgi:hypothetical protein